MERLGITVSLALTNVDTTHATASVGGGATTTLVTLTGKGSVTIVVKGNGNSNINQRYNADSGGATVISAANVEALVTVAFGTNLVIDSLNTDGVTPHNDSDVSWAGVYKLVP